MPTDVDLTVRILLAAFLGACIGLERELTGQNAGLRTHITISMGAALFAIGSAYSFTEFIQPQAETNYQVDVTRIASNIVTGVGFLGGGAIIKHGATVSGLTTAASMWVTAAVGMSVGLGTYLPAAITTFILLFVLTVLRGPRRWLSRHTMTKDSVLVELREGADAGAVVAALFGLTGVTVQSVSVHNANGSQSIQASIKGKDLHSRMAAFSDREDIVDIDMGA